MSRLLLVTGPGGAGTSSLARATADAIREEGASVEFVDAAAPAERMGAEAVAGALGGVFGALGADPLPMEAVAGLPGLRSLGLLVDIDERLRTADAVVVDAGLVASAREIVELPGTLARIVDGALTPSLAMWRAVAGEAGAFGALSQARDLVGRLGRLIDDPGTTVRLVVPPSPAGVEAATSAISLFAVLGTGVDAVILSPFPRGKDDVPKRERKRAQRALQALQDSADGVEVWTSSTRVRVAPKGRSALGPFEEVHRVAVEDLTVNATDESYLLDLALPSAAVRQARLGVTADRLVIEFDGAYRWLLLPPVLRRCAPIGAVRGLGGIRLEFRPDPDVWMGGGAT